jgi:hypothetical protein
MKAEILPPGTIPTKPGQISWTKNRVPRPWMRDEPKYELMVCTPNGEFFALVPEVHTVTGDKFISVSPSIVSPSHNYHGILSNGEWS